MSDAALGLRAWKRRGLRGAFGVPRITAIAYHAEGVCEGRSILRCWLRFGRGSLSFARRFPRLWSSSVTNSTGFLLLFGSGRSALPTFLAFLTQLLLVQIGLVLFIGKTTAKASGGNGQCRCNFYWPAARYHMPWAFIQRIGIRKRKLTTTRSTFMRHSLSYGCRLKSSNAEVAFVRANFTAGRGHAWEGGRAPRSGIEATCATIISTSRRPNLRCVVDQAMGGPAWTIFRFSFSLRANNPPMPSWRG